MDEKEYKLIHYVRGKIYLNCKYRYTSPQDVWQDDILLLAKKFFFKLYKKNVQERNMQLIIGDQEKKTLKYCFEWAACVPTFEGDLNKGLMLVSHQGFGKDVILKTIIQFYKYFMYNIREYTYHDFCDKWFNNSPDMFKSPIKINDITENGRMKREKESIPFLEFLDYREQNYLMRGLLVSSNYTPEALQEVLESDKLVKRLHERIKECFNVLIISNKESKRVENVKKI